MPLSLGPAALPSGGILSATTVGFAEPHNNFYSTIIARGEESGEDRQLVSEVQGSMVSEFHSLKCLDKPEDVTP